jgi:FLVCR family feline leukemia virus subgroup C receptor-related protein
MHPLFTLPAAYIIDTYGTRTGIFIGCLFGIIGISVRLFVNSSFAWVLVGQVLAGIGRPFILNCQAKISANWFTSQSRCKITQILTLILNVSLVLGIYKT